jgi:predicted nucleic acid-binding protein
MTFNRILVDTNICIDAAIVRKPYVDTALKIINLADTGEIEVKISAHTFDTIYYVLRKEFSISKRYTLIEELRSVFGVAPVTQRIIDRALKLRWKDFEDAIQHEAAIESDCDAIVTRNRSDFQESELPVLSPIQLLESLDS